MDDPSVSRLRERLRAFAAEQGERPRTRDAAERLAFTRRWFGALDDAGLAAPSWPVEVGGMGLSLREQIAYHEELTRAKAPDYPTNQSMIVAPTLIKHGTPEQRDRFLRPLKRSEELWCQGFSEPGAGSDLPALSTRAVRDGDVYRVTGQKVWTTKAHIADWMFALVRTGSPDSRGEGISYLLMDMRSPGITVRPLVDITGQAHFNEVFLDDVEVPVSQRIGEENGGWAISRTSLGHERATMSLASDLRYRRIVTELFGLAEQTGAMQDPVIRQDLARALTSVRILAAAAENTLQAVLRGVEPGASSSVNRLARAEFEQFLHELALRVVGPDAMLGGGASDAPERGRWTFGYLRTRASTIGAGTAEIQRNTIAEGVLALPRAARR